MPRRKKKRGNAHNLVRMPMAKCKKCGRTIFGGPKGMSTHRRKTCGKKKKKRNRSLASLKGHYGEFTALAMRPKKKRRR
jgi:hypothetical protein